MCFFMSTCFWMSLCMWDLYMFRSVYNLLSYSTDNLLSLFILKATKHCWKKLNKIQNKWENMSCLWIGVFNAFKMGTLPEFIYRFNGNFIRISIYLILWVKKLILKFLNNCKGFDITTNNNRNLEKEQSRKIRISQFHNLLENNSNKNQVILT